MSEERLLILGLGNPLMGDDGAGIQIVEELKKSDLPEYVDVIDGGTAGVGLIDLMTGYSRVIVVDAVIGEEGHFPGCISQREVSLIKLQSQEILKQVQNDGCSLHETELTSVLRLMQKLGMKIPEITIVGIPAVNIAPGIGLSEECRRYMQEAIKRLRGQVLLTPSLPRGGQLP